LKSELKTRWLALSESEQDEYEKKLEKIEAKSSTKRTADPTTPGSAEGPKKKMRTETESSKSK
jgi:hypothetical protein